MRSTLKGFVGKQGENLVAEYLASLSYKILDRNIREKFGEIDILAKDLKGVIHFVEVKTISADFADLSEMSPEDYLTRGKLGRMKKMAEWYALTHPKEVPGRYELDLAAIRLGEVSEIKFYSNLS